MNKVKVFRSGVVAAPVERGCEADSYLAADSLIPVGHSTGRTEAIFASPNLYGVGRWVRGNKMCNFSDIKVREITVDADSVMVYSINAWERASVSFMDTLTDKGAARIAAYWATGMTLTEWNARTDLDGSDWEVLISADAVISQRPVSTARVSAAQKDSYMVREIKWALS